MYLAICLQRECPRVLTVLSSWIVRVRELVVLLSAFKQVNLPF